jgi:tetraacyldisaccharide 4'-kinase
VRIDARSSPERRVRRGWVRGPGDGLRAASLLYAAGAELRRALHDLGILRGRRTGVPVLSVGGLASGGSGKTPLTSEIARRLRPGGRVGIVTHGFADEMALHRELAPGAVVTGGRDRAGAVREAVRSGARLVVVDGGFQRLSLWRDADVLAIPAGAARPMAARLPAGARREAWSALRRADAVVVTRREAPPEAARALAAWVRRHAPGIPVGVCGLLPGGLLPVNPAAREREPPAPGRASGPVVAVASIMYPAVFLRQLRETGLEPALEVLLPDHEAPGPGVLERIRETARGGHVVGTRKDAGRLREGLGEGTAVWALTDRVSWERGEDAVLDRIRSLVGVPPDPERPR